MNSSRVFNLCVFRFVFFFFCCFLIPNAEVLLDFAEMRVFCHMTKKIRMCDQSLEILLRLRTYLLDCFSSGSYCWILLKRIFRFLSGNYTPVNLFGHLATKFSICEQGDIFRVFNRFGFILMRGFCGKAGTLLLTKKLGNRDPSREIFSRLRLLLDRFLSRIYR